MDCRNKSSRLFYIWKIEKGQAVFTKLFSVIMGFFPSFKAEKVFTVVLCGCGITKIQLRYNSNPVTPQDTHVVLRIFVPLYLIFQGWSRFPVFRKVGNLFFIHPKHAGPSGASSAPKGCTYIVFYNYLSDRFLYMRDGFRILNLRDCRRSCLIWYKDLRLIFRCVFCTSSHA